MYIPGQRTADQIRADIIASSARLLDTEPDCQAYRDEYIARDAFLSELFRIGSAHPA